MIRDLFTRQPCGESFVEALAGGVLLFIVLPFVLVVLGAGLGLVGS